MAAVALLGASTHPQAVSASGTVDTSFGDGGIASASFPGYARAFGDHVAIAPDGGIVVAGSLWVEDRNPIGDMGVARFEPDGSMSHGFGVNGRVTTGVGPSDDVEAVLVQPDGSVVIAGNTAWGTTRPHLARYLPDGRPDPDFGTNGVVDYNFDGRGGTLPRPEFGASVSVAGLVMQPDGKYVTAGTTNFASTHPDYAGPFVRQWALVRYLPDGRLDPTFGRGGLVAAGPVDGMPVVEALGVDAAGRLLIAGRADNRITVARFTVDGRLDPTFGDGGIAVPPGSEHYSAHEIAMGPSGTILVGASTAHASVADGVVLRLRSDGTTDRMFADDGYLRLPYTSVEHIEAEADGFVIAGTHRTISTTGNVLSSNTSRFDVDGRLLGSANTDGIDRAQIASIAVQTNGRVVAAVRGTPSEFAVARLVLDTAADVAPFTDVAGTTHAPAIAAVADVGIAGGFSDGTFRPNDPVTRGQMAAFLARTLNLATPSVSTDFTDVAGSTHAAAISAVADSGIAGGFSDGTFRPNVPVTRGQMAAFLSRMVGLPSTAANPFADVVGTTHETSIAAVADVGLAGGFRDGSFRPNESVTRGQMATFLARTVGTFGNRLRR